LKGDPGTVITKLADEQQIDLLVMGTVARTGVSGMFMGNTADSILRQVTCSVLAVKPAGFKSPVTLEAECKRQSSQKSGRVIGEDLK
jgi:hypothetical protein